MGLTAWSISNYLTRTASVPVTAAPFLLSIWGATTATGVNRSAIHIGDATGTNRHLIRIRSSDDTGVIFVFDGTNSSISITTADPPINNSWFHLAGEVVANNSHAILLNGGNRGSEGTTVNPTGVDRVEIGAYATGSEPWNGGLAEASIWSGAGMSAANMDSLAGKLYNGGAAGAGGNPLNITAEAAQPWTGKLLAYWTLIDRSATGPSGGLYDMTGNGYNLSEIGTMTVSTHPTIEAVTGGTPSPYHQVGYRLF